jgi:hypothetical protein
MKPQMNADFGGSGRSGRDVRGEGLRARIGRRGLVRDRKKRGTATGAYVIEWCGRVVGGLRGHATETVAVPGIFHRTCDRDGRGPRTACDRDGRGPRDLPPDMRPRRSRPQGSSTGHATETVADRGSWAGACVRKARALWYPVLDALLAQSPCCTPETPGSGYIISTAEQTVKGVRRA